MLRSSELRSRLLTREKLKGFVAVGVPMFFVFFCWNFSLDATAFSHVVAGGRGLH